MKKFRNVDHSICRQAQLSINCKAALKCIYWRQISESSGYVQLEIEGVNKDGVPG